MQKAGNEMVYLQQTYSESYRSFDLTEWVATDDGREPATVEGSGGEETLELTVMPNRYADGLHGAAGRHGAPAPRSRRPG